MLKLEPWPWFRKLFSKGAKPDVEKELRQDGEYENAQNMRLGSVSGAVGSLEKIGGEQVRQVSVAAGYVCIGVREVSGDEVSFWAHPIASNAPYVKVNGIVMVQSSQIPYRYDRPLQMEPVNRKQGGILFPADGESDQLFWDIAAIKAAYAAGEQTYFGQLNIQAVTVLLVGPEEWPEHVGNPNIGSGAAPGQYVFSLRYYNSDGDRSNRGPECLPIAVAQIQAPVYGGALTPDGQYPGGQTTGGVSNTNELIPTEFGIALQWQVDNRLGYAGMELICRRYNDGQGLNGPGITEVVARIPMTVDQFGMLPQPFVYPRDNNFFEEVPTDETESEQLNFYGAKSMEYVDNKVVFANIKLRDRIVDLEFRSVNGSTTFPFTDRVFTRYNGEDYNDGYSDPVNNTNKKSAQHDERYDIGLMFRDGNANRSPVFVVGENVQMPERARRKTNDSLFYSSDPVYRTNTECQGGDKVSPTFDAIVQGNKQKFYSGPNNQYVNVINGLNYNPWSPKSPDDANSVRYRVAPIQEWTVSATQTLPETGFCYANETHALGVGVYGPTNMREVAPWARIISPMRSNPAGRVIAEGTAFYSIDTSESIATSTRSKTPQLLRSFFPDIASGFVPSSIVEDITANPRNYRMKFTPMGFKPEIYGYRNDFVLPSFHAYAVDQILYGNIQFDSGTGTPNSVNVGEPPGQMGVQPPASAPIYPTNYVGYQAYRQITSTIPAATSDPNDPNYIRFMDPTNADQGAVEIGFDVFNYIPEGRGGMYQIRTLDRVYRSSGAFAGPDFSDEATRKFHEPMWIVQIIRTDAVVPQQNVKEYIAGGQHIAVERCIGIYNTPGIVDIELFHARKYDAAGRTGADQRYIYVRSEGVPERRWICASGNAVVLANFATIISDINTNGFWTDPDGNEVYGLYSVLDDTNSRPHPFSYVQIGGFNQIPAPPLGSRIIVKYDEREPIMMQGFDCTISPSIWALFDRTFNRQLGLENAGGNTQAFSGAPMPYRGGVRNDQYVLPRDGANSIAGAEPFENTLITDIASFRQLVIMTDIVSRTPLRLNTAATFPRQHYAIRPSRITGGISGAQNGFNPLYDLDYPGEAEFFAFGGFKFLNESNLDYSKTGKVVGLGVPLNGENPRTELPTGFAASETFNPLAQDRPGLRTFPISNLFVANERNGEVKFIAALDQGMSQQLWAWAEKGYFRIPYNKQILVGADGNLIGTQSVSNFWPRQEQWVAQGDHGMPDQMWRMAVKANVPFGQTTGDTVFWTDRTSAYQLVSGTAADIAVNEFQSVLQPELTETEADYQPGYASLFNRKNNEWWIQFGPSGKQKLFVFDATRRNWVGSFTYRYDQYLSIGTQCIGYRNGGINNLDKGFVFMDGTPVEGWAEAAFTPYPGMQCELVSWRVNPDKPDELRIYDKNHALMVLANEIEQEAFEAGTGFLWVMEIDGWQQMMNSTIPAYQADRQPPQSTGFYMRIYFNRAERQRITFASLQSKALP